MHSYGTEKHSILSTFVSLGKMKTLLRRSYNKGASKALELNGFYIAPVAYPGILFGGWGVQQIHLRTEDRENGDLEGAVAPSQGFWKQL